MTNIEFFRKECPELEKAVFGKQFLLPQYRHAQYAKNVQDELVSNYQAGQTLNR